MDKRDRLSASILIEGGAAAALAFTMAGAMAPRGVDVRASLSLADDERAVVSELLDQVGLTWVTPADAQEAEEVWLFNDDGPIDSALRERLRDDLSERFRRMEDA